MRQLKALFLTLLLALSLTACGNSAPNVEISETVLTEAKNDVAVLVDVRSPEEFKPIARGINEIWNKRLETIWEEGNSFKKECVFSENSEIWKINFNTEIKSKTK